MSFWKWRFAREGKDYPSYLRIKVSKRLCNRKHERPSSRLTRSVRSSRWRRTSATRRSSPLCTKAGDGSASLLGLRVGDVERTDYSGFRLRLPMGKTGKRTVPLFEAAIPPLSQWLPITRERQTQVRLSGVGSNPPSGSASP